MTKYCYLAGPIAGCSEDEAKDWREYVSERLLPHIKGVSPLRCEPDVNVDGSYYLTYDADPRFGTATAISSKNFFDTQSADFVLAYLPLMEGRKPSYGTLFEIGWASCMNKPLIVVTDDPYIRGHPLFKANVPWLLETLDQAIETVNGILKIYE